MENVRRVREHLPAEQGLRLLSEPQRETPLEWSESIFQQNKD